MKDKGAQAKWLLLKRKNNKNLKTDATQNFGEHEKIIQFKLEGNFDKNNYLFKLEYDMSPKLTSLTTVPLCNKTTLP